MSPHTQREKSRKTFDFSKKKEYARDETRATFLFIEKENR